MQGAQPAGQAWQTAPHGVTLATWPRYVAEERATAPALEGILDTGCTLTCAGDSWLLQAAEAGGVSVQYEEDAGATSLRFGHGAPVALPRSAVAPIRIPLTGGAALEGTVRVGVAPDSTLPLLLSLPSLQRAFQHVDLHKGLLRAKGGAGAVQMRRSEAGHWVVPLV